MKAGAMKFVVLGGIAMMLVQYVPVYYHTMEFNRYVQEQTSRIRLSGPLTEAILSKAEEHKLPVTAENISMSTRDSVLRVSVDYQVPVNFYVFHQNMKFQARGSGLAPRSSY